MCKYLKVMEKSGVFKANLDIIKRWLELVAHSSLVPVLVPFTVYNKKFECGLWR